MHSTAQEGRKGSTYSQWLVEKTKTYERLQHTGDRKDKKGSPGTAHRK